MTSSIPLIRASGASPIEHALRATGRYRETDFLASGLPASPLADPNRLVSFHAYLNLLDQVTDSEGPDFACRSATPETLALLGTPWDAVRTSRTVREALLKVSKTFHFHASHVFFFARAVPGGVEITEAFPVVSTLSSQHAGHQQVAGMVSALGKLANGVPLEAKIKLSAHPELGVEHLKPYLGPDVQACAARQLLMTIPDSALDLVFPWEPPAFTSLECSLTAAANTSLSGSARLLIEGMLRDGNANLDTLARAAGRSRRTMQRLLLAEDTSFAELVDSVRHDLAIAELNGTRLSVSAIANGVGYSNTSSLTRAVRRWTDTPPSKLRSNGVCH